MGMSASQVRFLTLQGRKHSIGKQLTMLSNRKMALSRDMDAVALRYNKALNQKVLKWSNNSGEDYNTLSYDLMMRPNELNCERPYIVTKASTGAVVLNNDHIMRPDGTDSGLSYVDIATKISNCLGYDSASKTILFDTTGKNLVYDFDNNAHDPNAKVVGGKPSKEGWYIPTSHDYGYQTTFRTEILDQLGLLPANYKTEEKRLLDELYGSEEAQLKGVYPASSLWGKYYIALANLYAFEDYMDMEHTYASSDNFGQTGHETEQNYNCNTVYSYTDNINGTKTSPNTDIVQVNTNTKNDGIEPLAHIDFTGASGRVDSYHDDKTGLTFTANISSDGLTYNYDYESVWENGLEVFKTTPGYSTVVEGRNRKIDARNLLAFVNVDQKMGNPAQLVEIYHVDESSPFEFGSQICDVNSEGETVFDNTIYKTLDGMIDIFIGVMSSNQMLNLSKDDPEYEAMYNEAKQETIKLFMINSDSKYTSAMKNASSVMRAASDAALDKNCLGIQRTGGRAGIWPRLHGYTSVYVDVGSLCNVFLAYFDQLTQGKTLNPVIPSTIYDPEIPFYNDESANVDDIPFAYATTTTNDGHVVLDAAELEVLNSDGTYSTAYEPLTTRTSEVYNPHTETISTEVNKNYSRTEYNYVYDPATQTYQIQTFENPYFDPSNPSTWKVFGKEKDSTTTPAGKEVNNSEYYPEVDKNGNVIYHVYLYQTTVDDATHTVLTKTDNHGNPLYVLDNYGNKKQTTAIDGTAFTEVIKLSGNPWFVTSNYRYDNADDFNVNINKNFTLYKDATTNKPVALYTYDSATDTVKFNGTPTDGATVLPEYMAKQIRVYNPETRYDTCYTWDNQSDPDTWTGYLYTVITDPADGKKKTLAEYHLARATTVKEQMKYARCEEIKNYYTDFDQCWATYTAHDSVNNTDRIEYTKLLEYIPFSDTVSDGIDEVTGQEKFKIDPKITYDATTNTFYNHIVPGDKTYGKYNYSEYDVKNIWVMDPENPNELITLNDAVSLRGLQLNPDTGLPIDPNINLYIEFEENDNKHPYDPRYDADDKHEMILTYTTNIDGYEWENDNDPNNDKKIIYGTLEYNLNYYYFETLEALNEFIEHPNPDNITNIEGAHVFDPTVADHSSDNYDEFYAQIEAYDKISKYNISVLGYSINNEPTHEHLQKEVYDAMDRIKKKEQEIEDLYAKNGKSVEFYDALFTRVAEAGWTIDDNTSKTNGENAELYLNNKLQNNDFFVTVCESKTEKKGYNYTTKMAQNVRKIYSVYDEEAVDIAIAEYESEKREIQAKEDQIDLVMVKLETEQEAIETTMESVKKVIEDNIKKTFKMFA